MMDPVTSFWKSFIYVAIAYCLLHIPTFSISLLLYYINIEQILYFIIIIFKIYRHGLCLLHFMSLTQPWLCIWEYLPIQNIFPLFPPSSPPVCWLRISPMSLCDKTPNPNETKGLDVSGCCPPAALHYQLSISTLRSVSAINTRSFLSPNNYLTSPSQTIPFVLNLKSCLLPCHVHI